MKKVIKENGTITFEIEKEEFFSTDHVIAELVKESLKEFVSLRHENDCGETDENGDPVVVMTNDEFVSKINTVIEGFDEVEKQYEFDGYDEKKVDKALSTLKEVFHYLFD